MSKKKKRIDTSAERMPLTANPFDPLRGRTGDLPQAPDRVATPGNDTRAKPAPGYSVGRTRKGGWPVRTERRAAGKTVTVVENVSGDAAALLAALRKRCGAGGAVRDGAVEIQGDHSAAIAAYLDDTLS